MPTQRPAPTAIRHPRRTARPFDRPIVTLPRVARPVDDLPILSPSTVASPAVDLEGSAALPGADRRARELARELHDELGSLLTAARLDVAWLKQQDGDSMSMPQAQGRLARLETLLLEGHARLRQVVQGLYPRSLELFGLPAALHMLVRDQSDRFPGRLFSDIADDAQADGPAALALYRCAQECLTNLHRHAAARQARLTLMRQGDRVQLQIRDDGCGFDPDGVGPDHHGLAGLRDRLRSAGGEFEILSRPGQGTCITASVLALTSH
jgi:signal transduction histidine kinase